MNQGLTMYLKSDTIYSLQVHQKRPMCPTCDNTFIGLSEYTFPFMFTREASGNSVTSFTVKDTNDDVIETLSNSLIGILNAGDVDYIYCNLNGLGQTLECGLYYYELTMGSEVYYSEVFSVISKDLEFSATNIAVNGEFETDLSGWTVSGAVWDSGSGGRALLQTGNSISQSAPGSSLVKVTVTTLNTFTDDMEFSYGSNTYSISPGTSTVFYVPSGMVYTIRNNDIDDANDMYVTSVAIVEIYKVECFNLIVARNSCNKNSIPYVYSGYTDVFVFDAELAEPEYRREDEDSEDGNKDKSVTFMKILKRWAMKTSAKMGLYEPFVDELNKLPANDTIYIFNDIWKKEFRAYQSTLDIEVPQAEWLHDDKCNASVTIIINETLALTNACCEEIQDLECCDSFIYEYEIDEADLVTITIDPESCPGMRFVLNLYTSDVLTESIPFETTVQYTDSGSLEDTYEIVGSRFGCPDIIYNNLS